VSRRMRKYICCGVALAVLAGGGMALSHFRSREGADKTPPMGAIAAAERSPRRKHEVREVVMSAPVSRGNLYARALPSLAEPHLVVEKSQGRLVVYDGGKAVKAYRVVTGSDVGDKVREGDRRTPEGEFYICVRNAQSQFTRSLGLSYPSLEDAERGLRDGLITRAEAQRIREAIRGRRQPPWKTALGGEIMLHGGGADRPAGTAGCVGMDDADIRELFAALKLGTPVTIRR